MGLYGPCAGHSRQHHDCAHDELLCARVGGRGTALPHLQSRGGLRTVASAHGMPTCQGACHGGRGCAHAWRRAATQPCWRAQITHEHVSIRVDSIRFQTQVIDELESTLPAWFITGAGRRRHWAPHFVHVLKVRPRVAGPRVHVSAHVFVHVVKVRPRGAFHVGSGRRGAWEVRSTRRECAPCVRVSRAQISPKSTYEINLSRCACARVYGARDPRGTLAGRVPSDNCRWGPGRPPCQPRLRPSLPSLPAPTDLRPALLFSRICICICVEGCIHVFVWLPPRHSPRSLPGRSVWSGMSTLQSSLMNAQQVWLCDDG